MNAYSPQAYTIPGVDSMQADSPPTHLTPRPWPRSGPKSLNSTSMGAACRPMPV